MIGPGGKNIRRIVEITGAQVDIDEDNSGKVNIYATSEEAMNRAIQEIDLACGEIEEGKIYRGIVKGVKEFGCFVEALPGQEGLVHISELADFRVKRTEDVCKPGDEMVVKCIGIDEKVAYASAGEPPLKSLKLGKRLKKRNQPILKPKRKKPPKRRKRAIHRFFSTNEARVLYSGLFSDLGSL